MSAPKLFRLPPGTTTLDERDEHDEQMLEWLEYEIDQQNIQAVKEAGRNASWIELCKDMARDGDMQPLRELYPQIAEFIHRPPRGRGRPRGRRGNEDTVRTAADITQRIRALWVEKCGTKRRYRGEKSAVEFAVEIVRRAFPKHRDLTVEAVERALKPSGKHKPSPKRRKRKPR